MSKSKDAGAAEAPATSAPEAETPDLSPEAIGAQLTVRKNRQRLSLEEIDLLQQQYREVATADDPEAKQLTRAIVSRLRRVTHAELHPDCPDVTVTIPLPPLGLGKFYTIGDTPYFGEVTVHRCVAQQLLHMVSCSQTVDAERLRDGGRVIDLDASVAERARRIQAA